MKVSAIIVTRGNVDCDQIVCSFPPEWEVLLWDNTGTLTIWRDSRTVEEIPIQDTSVYGRYAAIEYAVGDVIYVQDDDVLVSDPARLVQEWEFSRRQGWDKPGQVWDGAVCNMPPEFRHEFYRDHALVGFGAAFHRAAPAKAFDRFQELESLVDTDFHRTCDIVFTGLTPRVLVDVPKTDLPWATDESRMYRQPEHVAERTRMLELVKQVARG